MELLSEHERETLSRASRDAAAVLLAEENRARLTRDVDARLGEPDDLGRYAAAPIMALGTDRALRNACVRDAPNADRKIAYAFMDLAHRRNALGRGIVDMLASIVEEGETRERTLERLSAEDACTLLGTDPTLIAHDHPQYAERLREKLPHFAGRTTRALTALRASACARSYAPTLARSRPSSTRTTTIRRERAASNAITSQHYSNDRSPRCALQPRSGCARQRPRGCSAFPGRPQGPDRAPRNNAEPGPSHAGNRLPARRSESECYSAWNIDPLGGVIGVQN